MDYAKLMSKRYSVRRFKDTPVEQEKIDLLLEVARLAPTAANRQPQRIFLITKEEGLKKIDRCTRCRYGAPAVFIVCYDKTDCWVRPFDRQDSGQVDASIVTTNVMYRAEDLGLGTLWVMYFDPAVTVKEFNLPENLIPVSMLIFGYPADDAAPHERHFQRHPLEKIVYYRD
jgi:nitroreductase